MEEKRTLERILIVTYYWPPAGGPGVQRWLKFAKYLPEFGYEPIIYTPANPNYPLLDEKLTQEIPEGIKVLKQPIKEPYGIASFFSKNKSKTLSAGIIPQERKQSRLDKLLLWIRGNVFIPDARIGWVNPSVRYLQKYIQAHDIHTIITTGPPHSMHLIGCQLKEALNIKWIADFRDPWTTIGYHKELKLSKRSAEKHLELESKVLNTADEIIVTSKSTKNEFSALTAKPVTVITNGYDVEYVGRITLDEKFSLAHIGSFLSNRNPRVLWKAIVELRKENKEFKAAFQLKLIGKVSQEIKDVIAEFHLEDCTLNLGYVSHHEAVIEQRKSQVLLLVEIDSEDTKAIIPGKLFEYMAAERPILAIGPDEADFFEIIKQTNTGKIALYDEKDRVKEILLDYFEKYQKRELKVYGMGLQYFSRKKLTEKLAQVLKDASLVV